MKRTIDIEALLAPVSEENPSGEDLRYSDVYEQIKEARRFDDSADQGEWKTDLKTADWDKVISLATGALSKKTKDLQIAAWLTEALIITEGFEGCATGLKVMNGLLQDFWDSLYPPIEDDDLEYRIAPLEFMNEKLWSSLADVSLTDRSRTQGYSWLKWQESRQVGYDSGVRDEEKRKRRDEFMAEGKLTADQFDAAVAASSPGFYKSLSEALTSCTEEFKRLDALADEKFGKNAPRLTDFEKAIEESNRVVQKICKDKGLIETSEGAKTGEETAIGGGEEIETSEELVISPAPAAPDAYSQPGGLPHGALVDTGPWEQALWEESLRTLKGAGIKKALEKLTEASLSAPSPRQQNRYKLFLAKLCIQAGRSELARPVLEQLYGMIEELHLERWESPVWIADVFGALYQCLLTGEPSDEDVTRAQGLFQRLCTIDMTKAIAYRK